MEQGVLRFDEEANRESRRVSSHQAWGLSAPMMLVSLVRRANPDFLSSIGLNEVRIKAGARPLARF